MAKNKIKELLADPRLTDKVRESISLVTATGLPHHFRERDLLFSIKPGINPFPSEAEFYSLRNPQNPASFGINLSARPFISHHHAVWVYSGNPMTQEEFIRLKPPNPKGYLAILEQRGTRVAFGTYSRVSGEFSVDFLTRFSLPFAESA